MYKLKSIRLNYEGVLFGLYALILFLTPLIFTSHTNELFEFPKMFFIYVFGATVIFLFTVNRVLTGRIPAFPNKLVLLFLVGFFVSTAFSGHLYTSLWGYYTRFNGGLISVLIFLGIYLVATNTFKKPEFDRLLKLGALAVVPVSIYGIAQYYELVENFWSVDAAVRVFSTFGQPNWLAAYLAMLLVLILGFIFRAEGQKFRVFWSAVYIFGFMGLWFTYSVSGLLGFTIGLLVFICLNRKNLRANTRILVFLLLISFMVAILNLGVFKQRFNDVFIDAQKLISYRTDVYAQEEVEADQYLLSDTGLIRTGLWKGTVNLIFSHPKNLFLGTGPETFAYEFPAHRPESLNYTSEWNFVFNKPHNYYLETLSQLGLAGFIPYILLLGWTLKKKNPLATPALASLYVTNFFGWPTVATALLFWLLLAFLEVENA
jgi:putative inorganic carbon (hco3(-)) transporter